MECFLQLSSVGDSWIGCHKIMNDPLIQTSCRLYLVVTNEKMHIYIVGLQVQYVYPAAQH